MSILNNDGGHAIAVAGVYLGLGAALLGGLTMLRPPRVAGLTTRMRGLGVTAGGVLLAGAALALPAPATRVAAGRAALDALMPRYQFAERHEVYVDAPPAAALAAVRAVTAGEIRGYHTLTWIRRFGRDGPPSLLHAPADRPMLDVAARSGFVLLADVPAREVVYGNLGAMSETVPPAARTPAAFRAADAPGYLKLAMNFHVAPSGSGAVVSTETRVLATDPGTRRRFARYWRVIYPGSALIRRSWLAAIRRRAEAGTASRAAAGRVRRSARRAAPGGTAWAGGRAAARAGPG